MPKAIRPFLMLTIILLGGVASNAEAIRPFDGKQFHGRIAYSSDGNFNDPDDWAASPMSLALIAAAGLQEKLVHFHYNSILWASEAIWERRHQEAVLQAAERFGFDKSRFFDCRQQPKETVAALAREVEKSTQADPLYVILAGPVDVILAALKRAPEQSRRWVYVISHSRWNEGFRGSSEEPASGQYHGIVIGHTKRDVIALGVRWVQIPDQNLTLCAAPYVRATALGYPTHSRWAPAPKEAFAPYFWLRDSADANFHLLWTWLEISTRPDPSDAGMTYFLLTGDPVASPEKIRHYLSTPAARSPRDRDVIRLEAENFALLENYRPATTDRQMSHALGLLPMLPVGQARLQTIFDEPYIAEKAVYDLFFAYVAPANEMFITTVLASGREVGSVEKKGAGTGVEEVGLGPVVLTRGDSLEIQLEGTLPQLDYVELRRTDASGELPTSERIAQKARSVPQPASSVTKPHERFSATGPLDNPRALPGQVIVAGRQPGFPGYLKINGGSPLFLCGPDNPEDFLFLGQLHPDGTRSGPQMEIIEFLGKTGVNAFHCQMFRMRRCNIKDEGDDTHCPFVDHDPAKGLNPKVLDQWDHWLGELEKRGIVVHLEFYNDATDVTRMGWHLDESGNLHPQERAFIEGVVRRFMHRKNIIWGIAESSNKLPRSAVRHFRKIAEVIRQVDVHEHPIVKSLVTPETAEKDIHPDNVGSEDYRDDPVIDIVTWLHIPPHGEDYESQYRAYLRYAWRDRDRFILMKNETEYHPIERHVQRIHNWAAALAGMHALEAQLNAARADRRDRIVDAGKVVAFMEKTDWYLMKPASEELAAGSTRWVLARPGESYILYTYRYDGPMGLKDLPAGEYRVLWFDTITGAEVESRVQHAGGPARWEKPESLGTELAVYIRRLQ